MTPRFHASPQAVLQCEICLGTASVKRHLYEFRFRGVDERRPIDLCDGCEDDDKQLNRANNDAHRRKGGTP